MIDTYPIEKNISKSNRAKVYRYPYAEMDIDDSFFVPLGKINTINTANYRASQRLGWRFSSRAVEGGVRVWRVS